MSGFGISTVSFLLCGIAFAASPDYFPLQPGNQWVFRCQGTCGESAPVVEILKAAEFDGRMYSLLKGFHGRETWLRQDDTGVLWAYDPESRQESRWYSFFAAEGESFDTSVEPCSPIASVASRSAKYQGPSGEFLNGLEVAYAPGSCTDAGLARELFLPWIGLIHRTETTIAGPRSYDLIYSRTGGVTVLGEPLVSFTLTVDKGAYVSDLMPPVDPQRSVPVMTARLTLRNTTDRPLPLSFPSGQRYDLELRNEKGETVYRWSDGRAFPLLFEEEPFGPGERNYTVTVRLADRDGNPLPPGKYIAEGWLATSGQSFRASTGFEIFRVL